MPTNGDGEGKEVRKGRRRGDLFNKVNTVWNKLMLFGTLFLKKKNTKLQIKIKYVT